MANGSIAECFGRIEKQFTAWGIVFAAQRLVDITAKEDGKVIIVYQLNECVMNSHYFTLPMFTRYEFNDQGQMDKLLMLFNPRMLPEKLDLLTIAGTSQAPGGLVSMGISFTLGCAVAALFLQKSTFVKSEPLLG
jgi:hypothetical protein